MNVMPPNQDRLVLLGTKGGPAIRKGGPSPTAHLLVIGGHPYVIDCGLGVTRGLVEAGMPLPAFGPCAGNGAADPHRLDRRFEGKGGGAWAGGHARCLAGLPYIAFL